MHVYYDMNGLNSLVISESKGIPLAFKVLLPPNLPAVAPRDRIMVKIEAELQGATVSPEKLDRGRAYLLEPPHFLVAMLIESWCEGSLFGLLELSRDRLSQLLQPLEGQAAVYSIKDPGKALVWVNGKLSGVHDYLRVDKPMVPVEADECAQAEEMDAGGQDEAKVAETDLTPMRVDGSTQFLAIALPSRESVVYRDALDLVKLNRFKLEPSNGKWWLRDQHRTLSFLAEHWQEFREKYRAEFSQCSAKNDKVRC